MALDPITAVLDIGGKIIDKIWPDPTERDKAKLELFRLQQQGELQEIAGQLAINAEEAKSSSIFVAGWRPGIGWVCVFALACQYVARPLLQWVTILTGHEFPPLPGIDNNLWELMLGMLGLGGLRSWEKKQGVAS